MSSDTSQRWLLPDLKWKAIIEDYALVNCSASRIRGSINTANNNKGYLLDRVAGPCECFAGGPKSGLECCYAYTFMAEKKYILIYADVDDTKPKHKQMLAERAWTEELLVEEETQYAAVREDFIASLPDSDESLRKFRERSKDRKQPEKIEDIFFEVCLHHGGLHPDLKIKDFLLGLESPRDRQRFLQMFSGKTRVKHKRPIMLLIRTIDTERTTVPDSTGGYAIAMSSRNGSSLDHSIATEIPTHSPALGLLRTRETRSVSMARLWCLPANSFGGFLSWILMRNASGSLSTPMQSNFYSITGPTCSDLSSPPKNRNSFKAKSVTFMIRVHR